MGKRDVARSQAVWLRQRSNVSSLPDSNPCCQCWITDQSAQIGWPCLCNYRWWQQSGCRYHRGVYSFFSWSLHTPKNRRTERCPIAKAEIGRSSAADRCRLAPNWNRLGRWQSRQRSVGCKWRCMAYRFRRGMDSGQVGWAVGWDDWGWSTSCREDWLLLRSRETLGWTQPGWSPLHDTSWNIYSDGKRMRHWNRPIVD